MRTRTRAGIIAHGVASDKYMKGMMSKGSITRFQWGDHSHLGNAANRFQLEFHSPPEILVKLSGWRSWRLWIADCEMARLFNARYKVSLSASELYFEDRVHSELPWYLYLSRLQATENSGGSTSRR
ncbi:hypothetical protein KQX54_012421 [Cotesia glomerata]|uniref:Uncharacterized protein n=1 Tax=Cotesia glomerata TaxID=32391 RepID=A0AAV7J4U4_COTGL|nr:hypothetical protein KQX54_012421 [Cotesia glomerata]